MDLFLQLAFVGIFSSVCLSLSNLYIPSGRESEKILLLSFLSRLAFWAFVFETRFDKNWFFLKKKKIVLFLNFKI